MCLFDAIICVIQLFVVILQRLIIYIVTMRTKIDVRRAITDRGYTITSFAEKSGMKTQNIIQNIINGNPTIKKLEELCEKLECDITDLFYSVDSEHDESIVDRNTSKCQDKQDLQDRQETMFCPRCGTKFVIVNTPKGNEQ